MAENSFKFLLIDYWRSIDKKILISFLILLLIGLFFTIGTLASYYTSKMNTTILKKIFAVIIIIIGTLILLNKDENQQTE